MTTRWLNRVSVLLIVGVLMVLMPSAAAQCSIPQGWQPYSIVRGDNLYRIARRFNTTVATLRTGNCMTGTLIFAGQLLYVPAGQPRPTTPPPLNAGERQLTVSATYQRFEHGFMIWRSDTGDIWVYEEIREPVKSRNRLTVYPVNLYGGLPTPNVTPAPGLVLPVMGFGKVWGNLERYRETLGWGIYGETGFSLHIKTIGSNFFEFNIPDGSIISRHADGFWSDVPGGSFVPISPPPTSTVAGTVPSVRIAVPINGSPLNSGTPVTISGEAVGIFEASFVLEVWAVPSGTPLASQVVTYIAAGIDQPGTWQVTLSPIDYRGLAEIRAFYIQPRDGTHLNLAEVSVNFE